MASNIIHVTVSVLGTEQLLSYELAPTTTIADLKSFVQAETETDQALLINGNPISDNALTVSDAGIKDNELIIARPASQTNIPSQPPQPTTSTSPNQLNEAEIETTRRRILNDPQARRALEQRNPDLSSTLNDPNLFRQRVLQNEREGRERMASMQRLNDDVNPENQTKLLEMIRRENLEKEMDIVMRDHPELMTRVTMLYISLTVNGHPVKAFVDSGAQATILSPSCAEACGITHLIDDRWSGIARGVGTAKILGRIHRANVKIGLDELPCAFTVMEGKDVDMLLGLDMLKRYQASIDLHKNCLTFPGGQSVEFLPEAEIPRFVEEEATVPGPGGTAIGAQSGALKPSESASGGGGGGGASSSKQPAFSGSSRTLGGGAGPGAGTPFSASPSTSANPTSTTAQAPAQAPAPPQQQPAPQTQSQIQSFPEQSIATLQNIGATREQAVSALRAALGNVDAAAALLFEGALD